MANVKINDLAAAGAVASTMQFETDIGGVTANKVTGAQLKTFAEADAVLKDGSVALTANWAAGAFKITAKTFESDVATGTAPFIVASTTKVPNLNAETVDGFSLDQDVLIASSPTFAGQTLSTLTVAGGIVQTDGAGVLSSSVTLPNGTLATTQTQDDNSTKVATTAYVDTAAPGITLDALTVGSNGQTAFVLAATPTAPTEAMLFLNGQVRIYTTDFTISGTALTWNDPAGVTLLTTDDFRIWYW